MKFWFLKRKKVFIYDWNYLRRPPAKWNYDKCVEKNDIFLVQVEGFSIKKWMKQNMHLIFEWVSFLVCMLFFAHKWEAHSKSWVTNCKMNRYSKYVVVIFYRIISSISPVRDGGRIRNGIEIIVIIIISCYWDDLDLKK